MRKSIIRSGVAEILRVMRYEGKADAVSIFILYEGCKLLDENCVIDSITLSVEGSFFVNGSLRRAQLYILGQLNYGRIFEKLFYSTN